jgi:hypothetical protein
LDGIENGLMLQIPNFETGITPVDGFLAIIEHNETGRGNVTLADPKSKQARRTFGTGFILCAILRRVHRGNYVT